MNKIRLWWCKTFHKMSGRERGLGCRSTLEWTCRTCGRIYIEEADYFSDGRVKRRMVTLKGVSLPAE